MAAPFYRVIPGQFVVIDKEPDGDSIRFVADDPRLFRDLHRAHYLGLSQLDGSVQLRFEGVDTPEAHYGEAAQPLGRAARDQMLARLGFARVEYRVNESTRVLLALPATVRGAILSQAADTNGRPIVYVVPDGHTSALALGAWQRVDGALLDRTINHWLLATGLAYLLVYTSTPLEHRELLRATAAAARQARLGVWARDRTAEFSLRGVHPFGPDGQLILPKLFRRCTDYLQARQAGYHGSLIDWLMASHGRGRQNKDDRLVVAEQDEMRLSDLVEQRGQTIQFRADVLDLSFVEKY